MSEERLPCSRGRTLNGSMALATLGLVIFLRASICWAVRVTGGPPWLDGVLALLGQQAPQLLDRQLDLLEVRIHLVGALEVVEGALVLVEREVDLAVAG